ncbi:MAG: helix-hairpin-helix domain-containing protein, partial [Oceanipulchritudo sp.]
PAWGSTGRSRPPGRTLRRRKLRESVLDDFPGLGPRKRAALMGRFISLENLRKAKTDELEAVEGIGPKLARRLRSFLDTL